MEASVAPASPNSNRSLPWYSAMPQSRAPLQMQRRTGRFTPKTRHPAHPHSGEVCVDAGFVHVKRTVSQLFDVVIRAGDMRWQRTSVVLMRESSIFSATTNSG